MILIYSAHNGYKRFGRLTIALIGRKLWRVMEKKNR